MDIYHLKNPLTVVRFSVIVFSDDGRAVCMLILVDLIPLGVPQLHWLVVPLLSTLETRGVFSS